MNLKVGIYFRYIKEYSLDDTFYIPRRSYYPDNNCWYVISMRFRNHNDEWFQHEEQFNENFEVLYPTFIGLKNDA